MAIVVIRLETDKRDALLILCQPKNKDSRMQGALIIHDYWQAAGLPVNSMPSNVHKVMGLGTNQVTTIILTIIGLVIAFFACIGQYLALLPH